MANINGFIIANREWDAITQLEMGKHTFGRTAGEAWTRHLQPNQRTGEDRPIFIQRWTDKGYGPIAVNLALKPA